MEVAVEMQPLVAVADNMENTNELRAALDAGDKSCTFSAQR